MISWDDLKALARPNGEKPRKIKPRKPLKSARKCDGSKKAFPSRERANYAAKALQRFGPKLHSYWCKTCHVWHLGHFDGSVRRHTAKPKRKKRRRR